MIGLHRTKLFLGSLAIVGLLAATASADLLTTGTPYDGWSGTTYFSSATNPNLHGYVKWAVFGPDDFPFDGFTPNSGELTYVYQVFNEGSDNISFHITPIDTTADHIGSFSDASNGVTGDAPTSMNLIVPGSASWGFSGIVQWGNSEGLCYNSTNTPVDSSAIEVNGGTVALTAPIPVPGANPIPEPAAIVLLCAGLVAWIVGRRLRRDV